MARMVNVVKTCMLCGKPNSIVVDEDKYIMYVEGRGMPAATHGIQVIFPELTADEREVLISGSHSECWDRAFGSDE